MIIYMEQVILDEKAISDLSGLVEDLQLWLESLELASDPKVMESLKISREQIKNREFGNWDDL